MKQSTNQTDKDLHETPHADEMHANETPHAEELKADETPRTDELKADEMHANETPRTDEMHADETPRTDELKAEELHVNGDVSGVKHPRNKQFAAATLAKIGVLTALSYILYKFVKFPLAFMFPQFLDIQFSDLPALLAGFAMGPVAGSAVVVLKCLLKMPFTSTGTVGEWGDIIIGIAFVLPATLIYRRHKSKKGALLGLLVGTVVCVLASVLANRTLLIPIYVKFWKGWDNLLNFVRGLYPNITVDNFYAYYLGLAIVPFNILRCAICSALTFAVYKPLSKVLHWEGKK